MASKKKAAKKTAKKAAKKTTTKRKPAAKKSPYTVSVMAVKGKKYGKQSKDGFDTVAGALAAATSIVKKGDEGVREVIISIHA